MTSPLRAVLLDVRTFLADNNIRRNTSGFSVNYGSTSDGVSTSSFSMVPSASKTLATAMDPCVVTVLHTSSPLTVQITSQPVDPLASPVVFTVTVSKLLILDSNVRSLVLTNPSTVDTAKVSLQQG